MLGIANPARSTATQLRGSRIAPLVPPPDYVVRCPYSQHPAGGRQPLMLHLWPKGQPDLATRRIAKCGSWRCDHCCRWRSSVDFARIKEALGRHENGEVSFIVLTLDRDGFYSGEAWADAASAYRRLSAMSRVLMRRWNRLLKKAGLDPIGNRWVGTVEAHRSGWPHLNLVVVSRGLAAMLADAPTVGGRKLLAGELGRHAVESGWGPQSTAEVARSPEALAGYVVKLAAELDDAFAAIGGEVAKMTQVPRQAPKGTRRLRSGRGFLPPRRRNPLWTGALLLRYDRPDGACARVYGRGDVKPAPWARPIDRLKYLRRSEAVLSCVLRESRATSSPIGLESEHVSGKNQPYVASRLPDPSAARPVRRPVVRGLSFRLVESLGDDDGGGA